MAYNTLKIDLGFPGVFPWFEKKLLIDQITVYGGEPFPSVNIDINNKTSFINIKTFERITYFYAEHRFWYKS